MLQIIFMASDPLVRPAGDSCEGGWWMQFDQELYAFFPGKMLFVPETHGYIGEYVQRYRSRNPFRIFIPIGEMRGQRLKDPDLVDRLTVNLLS